MAVEADLPRGFGEARRLRAWEAARQALGAGKLHVEVDEGRALDRTGAGQLPVEASQAGHSAPDRSRRRRLLTHQIFGISEDRLFAPRAKAASLKEARIVPEIARIGPDRMY